MQTLGMREFICCLVGNTKGIRHAVVIISSLYAEKRCPMAGGTKIPHRGAPYDCWQYFPMLGNYRPLDDLEYY